MYFEGGACEMMDRSKKPGLSFHQRYFSENKSGR
jgi:hypothetical protein